MHSEQVVLAMGMCGRMGLNGEEQPPSTQAVHHQPTQVGSGRQQQGNGQWNVAESGLGFGVSNRISWHNNNNNNNNNKTTEKEQ